MRYTGRPNLAHELAVTIRDMIVDADLPPGDRLNEVHLAAELGVSRTPLREALGRLAAEGAITAIPRIGFFVKPLTVGEFEQIYPIRVLMDPEALRLAGIPSRKRLERLKAIDRRIVGTNTPGMIVALADEWHLELIADCPNRVLIELIEQFMVRTRRYEMAFLREQEKPEASMATHEELLELLEAGDLYAARACLLDQIHLRFEPIITWLRAR